MPSILEYSHRFSSLGASAGAFCGLVGGAIVSVALYPLLAPFPLVVPFGIGLSILALSALGIRIGRLVEARMRPAMRPPTPHTGSSPKLLDTSAIIDGRLVDLCTTGFLEGPLLISRCVLHELQLLADSAQTWKRVRGKRGLDILHHMRQLADLEVRIVDDPQPGCSEVDATLVVQAKALSAKLITTDWNLNQVASLQGVAVLNVNDLCHRLQPAILPGETIRVHLFKEGQIRDQAIAHLDDGTMVVVEQAKAFIGRNVDVMVTGIHQTPSGRMLFGTIHTNGQHDEVQRIRTAQPS